MSIAQYMPPSEMRMEGGENSHELSPEVIHTIVDQVAGAGASVRHTTFLPTRWDKQSYLIRVEGGPDLAIQVRPHPILHDRITTNNPYWPHYKQELLGCSFNGAVETLPQLSALLSSCGTLRIANVLFADDTLSLVPAPYFVTEWLTGESFDEGNTGMTSHAMRDLADHLGSVHWVTGGQMGGFGIFSHPWAFKQKEWWTRFTDSFRTLTQDPDIHSPQMALLQAKGEIALARAVKAGPPASFPLICVDQCPANYIASPSGGISAMNNIENHLWAPREFELAMVELMCQEPHLLRSTYEMHLPWPETFEEVRDVYQLYARMERVYSLRMVLGNEPKAQRLESELFKIYL